MSAREAVLSAVRLWVAILAAWATAVAPLLPTGAAASPVIGPALVLCSAAGHTGGDTDRSTHDGTHLCCVGPAGVMSAGPGRGPNLVPPPFAVRVVDVGAGSEAAPAAPPERHPLAPRAPPASA